MAFRRLFIIILGWERVGVWLIGFMGELVGKVSEMELEGLLISMAEAVYG